MLLRTKDQCWYLVVLFPQLCYHHQELRHVPQQKQTNKKKSGLFPLTTATWVEARALQSNLRCLQLSPTEERSPPACHSACLHCSLLYFIQKEHQKFYFEVL